MEKKMKNTRENIIKVLKADIELLSDLETSERNRGNNEYEIKYQRERWGLERALWLLTDQKYFNDMYNIFKNKIERNAD